MALSSASGAAGSILMSASLLSSCGNALLQQQAALSTLCSSSASFASLLGSLVSASSSTQAHKWSPKGSSSSMSTARGIATTARQAGAAASRPPASFLGAGAFRGRRCMSVSAFNDTDPAAVTREQQRRQQELLLGKRRQAYMVPKAKAPLELTTYEVPPLRSGEVDIRVTHNGLCHSDLHMRDDDWGASKFPFAPGHEVVGEVVAVGPDVTMLKPGQRAGVGWIRDSCRRCLACLRGEENVCEKGYTGLIVAGNNGGFQNIMRVPSDFCYEIPDGLGSAEAAPLLCAGITVYAPLRRHIPHPGANVAVLGIGGLGHLGLQFAAAMGAVVTAIDVFPDKEAEARKLGADGFIAWGDTAALEAHTGKFDVLLNCASASIDTGRLLRLLANNGTLVQVGIPGGGAIMQLPLQDVVFGQKSVAGTIVGGRADMQEMLKLAATKGIKPMLELLPMQKVNEGLERVKQGKPRYRVVLVTDEDTWEK